MNVTKENVSPKKAAEWLTRNISNRPLSMTTVGLYKKAIEADAWKLNGDCIRFNGNGDLIDGQHRLTACVQAGKGFETYVVRGLDHDAFDTIDQGKKRTISDVFARQGYKHYVTLASAVRWLWRYEHGMVECGPMRPDEANELLEQNPAVHHAVEVARGLTGHQKLLHPGMLGFLIYECGRTDEDAAETFWTAVVAGEQLKRDSAAYRLHQRLIKNLGAVAKVPSDTLCALAIKAWNFHRTRKPCGTLKWSEGEDFPQIIH